MKTSLTLTTGEGTQLWPKDPWQMAIGAASEPNGTPREKEVRHRVGGMGGGEDHRHTTGIIFFTCLNAV